MEAHKHELQTAVKGPLEKVTLAKSHKFLTLDAFRGIAAITVMSYHYLGKGSSSAIAHGYLAVDFFFMLSGFVLSFAYQEKLDTGWSTSGFIKTRVIRLYPLYVLGLILGFGLFLIGSRFGLTRSHDPIIWLFLCFALGSFLLPVPGFVHLAGPAQFPFNDPSWSLFYELFANLFHAFFLRRKGRVFLCGSLVVAGAAVFYSASKLGTVNFGTLRSQFLFGFPRVMFSYTAGIILFKMWQRGWIRYRLNPYVGIIILTVSLVAPIALSHTAIYDLVAICIIFPSLIICLASSHPHVRLANIFQLLGVSSYAIYILHIPMILLLSAIWKRCPGVQQFDFESPFARLIFIAIVCVVAVIVDRLYDVPVRQFLREKLVESRLKG
jgi:peptidoglycan/LPS O-acetylase OafA/YrhL